MLSKGIQRVKQVMDAFKEAVSIKVLIDLSGIHQL